MSEQTEIADLEQIQDAGAASVKTEGLAVRFDLDVVRRRAAAKRHKLTPAARPRIARLNLSAAWGGS